MLCSHSKGEQRTNKIVRFKFFSFTLLLAVRKLPSLDSRPPYLRTSYIRSDQPDGGTLQNGVACQLANKCSDVSLEYETSFFCTHNRGHYIKLQVPISILQTRGDLLSKSVYYDNYLTERPSLHRAALAGLRDLF